MRSKLLALTAVAVLTAGTALACNDNGDGGSGGAGAGAPATMEVSTDTPAADLRAGLTALLQEHVYLAGTATGAALDGRQEDFNAAAAALDENSVAISKAIGSVYGADAERVFLDLWRRHIGFFVDYTTGKATGDQAKMQKAKDDLDRYRTDFGAFLSSANPNLTTEAVAQELKVHVDSLLAVVDAQAANDPRAFTLLRQAAGHMPMTANVLAGAIVAQFPDKFAG